MLIGSDEWVLHLYLIMVSCYIWSASHFIWFGTNVVNVPEVSKVAMNFLFLKAVGFRWLYCSHHHPLERFISVFIVFLVLLSIFCGFFNFISTSLMWLQLNQIQPNPAHPLCLPLVRPLQPNVLPLPPQIKRVLYPGQQHPLQPSAHQWQLALPRWV